MSEMTTVEQARVTVLYFYDADNTLSGDMDDAIKALIAAVRSEEHQTRQALVDALKRSRDFNGGIGALSLMCAPGESDRECLNRYRRELDDQIRAALKLAGEQP